MKMQYVPNESRGKADFGWLKSYHSYSFGEYMNPERMGFGVLRVINDDRVSAGRGFGSHPHKNMEIISIPTAGRLVHKDSMGNARTIEAGEVQAISAGTGVVHSEMNDSEEEEVRFFQIWILTREDGISPHYSQKSFSPEDRQNAWQLVVAPDTSEEDVVKIFQDAFMTLGDYEAEREASYEIKNPGNGVCVFVIEGSVEIEGQKLERRDALEIEDSQLIEMRMKEDSQILVIEVPMKLS